jgi:hypothetical protein
MSVREARPRDFEGFHHPGRWFRACKGAEGNLTWDPLSHPTEEA